MYGPSKKLQTPANVFVTNVVISDVLSEFIFVLRLVFLRTGRITSHLFVGLNVAELLNSTLLRLSALSRIRIASSRVHLLPPSSRFVRRSSREIAHHAATGQDGKLKKYLLH